MMRSAQILKDKESTCLDPLSLTGINSSYGIHTSNPRPCLYQERRHLSPSFRTSVSAWLMYMRRKGSDKSTISFFSQRRTAQGRDRSELRRHHGSGSQALY